MNRFESAHYIIDPGASNPSGVCRALSEAILEARVDDCAAKDDPACRLICYQLAHLMGMEPLAAPYAAVPYNELDADPAANYYRDADICRKITELRLTPRQFETLRAKWRDMGADKPTYLWEFLVTVSPIVGTRNGDGHSAVGVQWCGMTLGIEPNGYAHT